MLRKRRIQTPAGHDNHLGQTKYQGKGKSWFMSGISLVPNARVCSQSTGRTMKVRAKRKKMHCRIQTVR